MYRVLKKALKLSGLTGCRAGADLRQCIDFPPGCSLSDWPAEGRPEELAALLATNGCARISGLVCADEARAAGDELRQFLDELPDLPADSVHDGDGWVMQTNLASLPSFGAIAASGRPVINIRTPDRSQPDGGMMDIFRIEDLARERGMTSLESLAQRVSAHAGLAAAAELQGTRYRYCNCYVSRGIRNPRCLHIDGTQRKYKLFVYLNDVLKADDGPYTYVPGSHGGQPWAAKEQFYNQLRGLPNHDCRSVEPAQAEVCTGPAGTAVISDQSGVHGGLPQRPDAERLVLVASFS